MLFIKFKDRAGIQGLKNAMLFKNKELTRA